MAVKTSVEANALSNKMDVADTPPLGKAKLAQETILTYIPRQDKSSRIILNYTIQMTLLNMKLWGFHSCALVDYIMEYREKVATVPS